jgi:hypothetical protein
MASRILLNKFVRQSAELTQTDTNLYTAPIHRAGIIISALCTNTNTSNTITVNAGVSGVNSPTHYPIIQGFEIAPADSVNIVINKLVLGEFDSIFASVGPDVNVGDAYITLSILETRNDQ